jgi:hypothetical protein
MSLNAGAEVKITTVEYKQGDTVLEGLLAHDDAVSGRRPAILVAPQWKGVSDYEYNESADKRSWAVMQQLFTEIFAK